jgi:Uma2 family endonuclease
MSTPAKSFLTPEEYLKIERQAEYKSEYFAGEMFAMAGAAERHNLICFNIYGQLYRQLRQGPCRAYPSDMRVRVSATGLYTYPNVTALCGEPKLLDDHRDTLLNPGLIVEVLSPSTEAYDRGRKFEHYRSIESLAEYLLVASDRVQADLYTRRPDGLWVLSPAGEPGDTVELTSIGCLLLLADVYEKVDFEA